MKLIDRIGVLVIALFGIGLVAFILGTAVCKDNHNHLNWMAAAIVSWVTIGIWLFAIIIGFIAATSPEVTDGKKS